MAPDIRRRLHHEVALRARNPCFRDVRPTAIELTDLVLLIGVRSQRLFRYSVDLLPRELGTTSLPGVNVTLCAMMTVKAMLRKKNGGSGIILAFAASHRTIVSSRRYLS